MASYVTVEDIETHGFQIAERDKARLEPLCEMQSRFFDKACGVAPNYFAKAESGAVASARVFWGDGTDLLKLDPYTSISTVAMPTGWTVPDYVTLSEQTLRGNDYDFGLIRVYGDNDSRFSALAANIITEDGANFNQFYTPEGWPDGIKVTVTAVWGYSATPVDVKLAVIEMVISAMRGLDQAYARVTNLETNTVTNAGALTPRAQMIADLYRNARAMFA